MRPLIFPEKGVGVADEGFHLLLGVDGRPRGHVVPPAVIFDGEVVDAQEAGAQPHADVALLRIVDEGDPYEGAADVRKFGDDARGGLEGEAELFLRLRIHIDGGDAVFGNSDVVIDVGLELEGGEVLHIEVGEEGLVVHAVFEHRAREPHRLPRDALKAEPSAVRHHAHVDVCRGLGGNFEAVFERDAKVRDHLAGGGAEVLHPIQIPIGVRLDVVVDLDDLLRQSIVFIGNARPRARVDDDEKGVLVRLFGDDILPAAEGEIIGKVLIGEENFLFGIGIAEDVRKAHRRADRVAVGADMAGDDDGVVCLDLLEDLKL